MQTSDQRHKTELQRFLGLHIAGSARRKITKQLAAEFIWKKLLFCNQELCIFSPFKVLYRKWNGITRRLTVLWLWQLEYVYKRWTIWHFNLQLNKISLGFWRVDCFWLYKIYRGEYTFFLMDFLFRIKCFKTCRCWIKLCKTEIFNK